MAEYCQWSSTVWVTLCYREIWRKIAHIVGCYTNLIWWNILFAVLRNVRDELLHRPVRCLSSARLHVVDGLGSRLQPSYRTTKVHEYSWPGETIREEMSKMLLLTLLRALMPFKAVQTFLFCGGDQLFMCVREFVWKITRKKIEKGTHSVDF